MVVIDNEDAELAELAAATCRQHLTGRCVDHDFFRFQVSVAFRQHNGEARASLTVLTALGTDFSVMHLSDGLAEVQTDARALHAHVVGIATLVEAVEDVRGILGLETHTGVDDQQRDVLLRLAQHHLHLAAVVGELERVRQQVAHNLVEVDAVNPRHHMVAVVLKGKRDVSLRGVILVELTDTADKVHHIRLAAMQLNLVLVNEALV